MRLLPPSPPSLSLPLVCMSPPPPLPPGIGPAVPQQCPETGSGFHMGGPFWAEPLHDPAWVAGLLAQVKRDKAKCAVAVLRGLHFALVTTACAVLHLRCSFALAAHARPPPLCRSLPAFDKLHSMLTAVSEELVDVPLYFDLHSICKLVHSSAPRTDVFCSALANAGYRCGRRRAV